jgi:DNA-binding response OmpR family regulator
MNKPENQPAIPEVFDKRVIVLDDETEVRRAIALALKLLRQHEVHEFATAVEANHFFHSRGCDLIVTDLRMPHQTGLEFARSIRIQSQQIPILLVTAHLEDVGNAPDALNAVNRILFKPFDVKELVRCADELLGRPAAVTAASTSSLPA